MLERMLGLRILILHDTLIKGYCTKVLSQLQFFYWGKSLVARDVRVPFQMGRLRKLETLILRANEIDLAMKVCVCPSKCFQTLSSFLAANEVLGAVAH
jgi:hypothetical protein